MATSQQQDCFEWYRQMYIWQYQCFNIAVQHQRKQRAALLLSVMNRRRWQTRPIFRQRLQKGFFNNLVAEMRLHDHESFCNFHRMLPEKFDELFQIVGPFIKKHTLHRDNVISPAERLSITLRFLVSGDSMASLSYAYRVSKSSVSNIIQETCMVIWENLREKMFPTPTEELWVDRSKRFADAWNFPNCIGAIDGKHVVMQAPNKAGSTFYNYKGTHSLVLLAVCDADYCLTLVDIGGAGGQSDGGVLQSSSLGHAIQNEKLRIPSPSIIPGSRDRVAPHLIVADAAFPLTNVFMRPYPQRALPDDQRIFNYRLSRARRVIENVFGIMAARWRLFRKPIIGKLPNIEHIIQAVCCLHNFLQRDDFQQAARQRRYCPTGFVDRPGVNGNIIDGNWRLEVDRCGALQPLGRAGANSYTRSTEQTREMLTDYFMNEGQVPWQRTQAGLE